MTPRTLIISHAFPPSEGGIQSYILAVARGLDPERTTVLAPAEYGTDAFDRGETYRIVRQPLRVESAAKRALFRSGCFPQAAAEFLDARAAYRAAAPIVAEQEIEVVQCAHVTPIGLTALWLKRKFGTKTLIYTHGKEIVRPRDFVGGWRLTAKGFLGADAVGVVSEHSREKVLEYGVARERTHKLWTSIDGGRFSPGPRDAELADALGVAGKKVILSAGRLVRRKGFDTVIRALPAVAERVPDVVYLVIGRGPERDRLEDLAVELGVRERVRFAGYVPDDRMPVCYRLADVFAMVCRELEDGDFEGFGIVFLEASASGVATLAGASGGAAEAVRDGETGLVVDPSETDAVVGALVKLLADETLRKKMGEAGVRLAAEEFSAERRMGVVRDLLREIATGEG